MPKKRYEPIKARFTKRFLRGDLEGITVNESMPFTSVKAAEQWFEQIKHAYEVLPYVIDNFEIDTAI